MRLALAALWLFPATLYAQHVAPTEAKTPEDERKSFVVPAGFDVQLVASEPTIDKPMQMAFDSKGRLWVTTSRHYPFAAPAGQSNDRLIVLSDFDANGLAKKSVVFDDRLNIPIGVLPLGDGSSCIVSSCGEILKLTDTDGDGKADKREVLYTGFGFKDTHGMTNSFTMMDDGWIYACHGFANDSKVKGKDGHEITMNSGHTFRFKPDGSRIEVYTRGQVNPFGMTVDPFGFLYTADCHSRPITQLIPGAYYDSFGKPHDGLGYAPHVTPHDHGSTGLCGLTWGHKTSFPKGFRERVFIGNVVTNRINSDDIVWKGASPIAKEASDLLVSQDPWFRPTDLKAGPDGHLYVCDFYNKIIGHYEVDLKHPDRDRHRGRLWRIVAKSPVAINSESTNDVAKAREQIVQVLQEKDGRKNLNEFLKQSMMIARVAVDLMTQNPHGDHVQPLWALLQKLPAEDTHTRHATRVALRNSLKAAPEKIAEFSSVEDDKAQAEALIPVLLGWASDESSQCLARIAKSWKVDAQFYPSMVEHIARHGKLYGIGEIDALQPQLQKNKLYGKAMEAFARGLSASGRSLSADELNTFLKSITIEMDSPNPNQRADALKFLRALPLNSGVAWPKAMFEIVAGKVQRTGLTAAEQVEACETLYRMDRAQALERIKGIPANADYPLAVREKAVTLLATERTPAMTSELLAIGKKAPASLAVAIANGVCATPTGADKLFAAVKAKEFSAMVLTDRTVRDRLKQTNSPGWQNQLADLTAGLATPDQRVAQVIRERVAEWPGHKANIDAGKALFETHCRNCHQLNGVGGKVGPNLDGIGTRGYERLLEDMLDPNRNVDAAFAATRLDLADGQQLIGFVARTEGDVIVFADSLGKEMRINKKDVEKQTPLKTSPMPADWGEKLKKQELLDVLGYVLKATVK